MSKHEQRNTAALVFLLLAGAIGIILLVIDGYQLRSFTDTDAFCGRLCHKPMYPEHIAYLNSPHSRVRCSECHIGNGLSYFIKSKITGIPLIFDTITGDYEHPIQTPVKHLRPATQTCEQCHDPKLFTGNLVLTFTTYSEDEKNTKHTATKIFRVGGGEHGSNHGIHWHIMDKVWYLPMDKTRQKIGWVGFKNSNGNFIQFVDPKKAALITPQRIMKHKRLMDCVDCHNRVTHIFSSPEKLIDKDLKQGKIDINLPFIKREGAKILDPPNSSLAKAYAKLDTIKNFYRTKYPQIYKNKGEAIDKAIKALRKVAKLTTFPFMKVTWKTHPNNLGHWTAPGCFRCHGKLVQIDGKNKGKLIPFRCNLCHYAVKIVK